MTIRYSETDAFAKDLKKLLKRFRTLEEDLAVAKTNAIELFHVRGIDNGAVLHMTGYGNHPEWQFYKIKKFACRTLKGRGAHSGIRVIYAYSQKAKTASLLEIYYKADQANENRNRILDFLKSAS